MPNRHRPAMPRGSLDTPRSVEARWKRQNETQFIVYSVYVHVYVDVYLSICLSVYLSVYRSNIHVHITVISHDKYMHIRRMIVFIYVYNIYIYMYMHNIIIQCIHASKAITYHASSQCAFGLPMVPYKYGLVQMVSLVGQICVAAKSNVGVVVRA